MEDQGALLRLFSAGALGYIHQWAMMGPAKIQTWAAYSALGAATLVLYWWATPEAIGAFQANWRFAIVGVISFFMTARGTGAIAAAANWAPRSDTQGVGARKDTEAK